MKKMFSWLIISLAAMFWIFRIIVCYTYSMGIDMGYQPFNLATEIIVLFVSLFSLFLVIGRWRIGGLVYCITYLYYFGKPAFNGVVNLLSGAKVGMSTITDTIISLFAVVLGIGILLDVVLNNDRHESKDNRNTHWFFKNKDFDRKLDERADKNQYRTKL